MKCFQIWWQLQQQVYKRVLQFASVHWHSPTKPSKWNNLEMSLRLYNLYMKWALVVCTFFSVPYLRCVTEFVCVCISPSLIRFWFHAFFFFFLMLLSNGTTFRTSSFNGDVWHFGMYLYMKPPTATFLVQQNCVYISI